MECSFKERRCHLASTLCQGRSDSAMYLGIDTGAEKALFKERRCRFAATLCQGRSDSAMSFGIDTGAEKVLFKKWQGRIEAKFANEFANNLVGLNVASILWLAEAL